MKGRGVIAPKPALLNKSEKANSNRNGPAEAHQCWRSNKVENRASLTKTGIDWVRYKH